VKSIGKIFKEENFDKCELKKKAADNKIILPPHPPPPLTHTT
jgi:hypothetical protein